MDPAATRSSTQTVQQFEKFVIPNYRRQPICLVRGEGSYVWDAEGKRYLDLFPGWGCNILGHCPPRVVKAIQEQVTRLIHIPNTWYTEAQGDFAEMLSTRGFGQAFFCNSGAEANEAALKLARLHARDGRYKVISFEDSFHGRTFATVTATAQPKYHEGLGPLLAGFRYAPRNNLDAVAKLLDRETCAILIEPVQGEGGINIPTDEFLRGLRKLADDNGGEHLVYVLLLAGRQTGDHEYSLYAYGQDQKPLIEAKFAEGTGSGSEAVTVDVKEVNEQAHEGKVVVTVFGKYQASFKAGHKAE